MSKPALTDLMNEVSDLLNAKGIKHALIGGIAIGLRGYPRSTVDIDYLVAEENLAAARLLLEERGFDCVADTGETLHFSGPGAIDFLIAKRAASLQMLDDASSLAGVHAPVVQVEDIIGLKIQAYCNDSQRRWKDQADIAELIRSNPSLNWGKVMEYAKLFSEEETLRQIRESMNP